jgi:hypothetical protein
MVVVGVSLSSEILKLVDEARGDITRSRWIFRLIEKKLLEDKKIKERTKS